jgi:hypothetical protein
MDDLLKKVSDVASNLVNEVKDEAVELADKAKEAIKNPGAAMDNLKEDVTEFGATVKDKVEGLVEKAKDMMDGDDSAAAEKVAEESKDATSTPEA